MSEFQACEECTSEVSKPLTKTHISCTTFSSQPQTFVRQHQTISPHIFIDHHIKSYNHPPITSSHSAYDQARFEDYLLTLLKMSTIEFSEREKEIMAKAWQCFDEEPKVGMDVKDDLRPAADSDADPVPQVGSDVWLYERP